MLLKIAHKDLKERWLVVTKAPAVQLLSVLPFGQSRFLQEPEERRRRPEGKNLQKRV